MTATETIGELARLGSATVYEAGGRRGDLLEASLERERLQGGALSWEIDGLKERWT